MHGSTTCEEEEGGREGEEGGEEGGREGGRGSEGGGVREGGREREREGGGGRGSEGGRQGERERGNGDVLCVKQNKPLKKLLSNNWCLNIRTNAYTSATYRHSPS